MAKQRTNMAVRPISITEPPNESALADTKHENQQKLAALAYEYWQARGCRGSYPGPLRKNHRPGRMWPRQC